MDKQQIKVMLNMMLLIAQANSLTVHDERHVVRGYEGGDRDGEGDKVVSVLYMIMHVSMMVHLLISYKMTMRLSGKNK